MLICHGLIRHGVQEGNPTPIILKEEVGKISFLLPTPQSSPARIIIRPQFLRFQCHTVKTCHKGIKMQGQMKHNEISILLEDIVITILLNNSTFDFAPYI